MWYRKSERVVEKPEYVWHVTEQKYDHPIIDLDKKLDTSKGGFNSQVYGPGYYTTYNKSVMQGYKDKTKNGTIRKQRIPKGARILDYNNLTEKDAAIITSFIVNQIPEQGQEELKEITDDIGLSMIRSLQDILFLIQKIHASNIDPIALRDIGLDKDAKTAMNKILKKIGYDAIEYEPGEYFAGDYGDQKNLLILNEEMLVNPTLWYTKKYRPDDTDKIKIRKETDPQFSFKINQLAQGKGSLFLFHDEIQNTPEFKEALKQLADKQKDFNVLENWTGDSYTIYDVLGIVHNPDLIEEIINTKIIPNNMPLLPLFKASGLYSHPEIIENSIAPVITKKAENNELIEDISLCVYIQDSNLRDEYLARLIKGSENYKYIKYISDPNLKDQVILSVYDPYLGDMAQTQIIVEVTNIEALYTIFQKYLKTLQHRGQIHMLFKQRLGEKYNQAVLEFFSTVDVQMMGVVLYYYFLMDFFGNIPDKLTGLKILFDRHIINEFDYNNQVKHLSNGGVFSRDNDVYLHLSNFPPEN